MKRSEKSKTGCAKCPKTICRVDYRKENLPEFCPMLNNLPSAEEAYPNALELKMGQIAMSMSPPGLR